MVQSAYRGYAAQFSMATPLTLDNVKYVFAPLRNLSALEGRALQTENERHQNSDSCDLEWI